MWAAGRPGVEVGVAAHSVRAVPREWIEAIARYAERHDLVRHIHAHEQRREIEQCQSEHGCSPIELLERTGFLGPRTSVIHGIHASRRDVEILARTGATVVTCPTTEGNLGDGYLPALAYRDARVPLALGSDSQVRIDPFEEARELETLARRERQLRSGLLATYGDLWSELVRNGCRSLGVSGSGEVEVDLDHPDLRGIDPADVPAALITCASAGVVSKPTR
jgi:formimidoylglutamate deiminase